MRTLYFFAFLTLLFSAPLSAQVGVDNPNPEQALDVAGKIKLTDDATPPTDGTIRYNAAEGAYEGYTAGEWEAFNGKSATPTGVDYLHFRAWRVPIATSVNSSWVIFGDLTPPRKRYDPRLQSCGFRNISKFHRYPVR